MPHPTAVPGNLIEVPEAARPATQPSGTIALGALQLRDFRSYGRLDIEFAPGVVMLAGANGAGKTNVLEACALVLSGCSPRTSSEFRCVREGCTAARVEATLSSISAAGTGVTATSTRSVVIEAGAGKRLERDGSTLRSIDAFADVPVITFLPEQLLVVRGAPARRRAVLDRLLSRSGAAAANAVAAYARVVTQRNAVLRHARTGRDVAMSLQPWSAQLVDLGEQVRDLRARLVAVMQTRFAVRLDELAGLPGGTIELELRCGAGIAAALAELAAVEQRRGTTLAGPHLDDVHFCCDGRDLRTHGSTGEQRAALLAWSLAARDMLEQWLRMQPIVLLDEPYAELDAARRARLTRALQSLGQVIITTTEPPSHALDGRAAQLLKVECGTVSPWSATTS